MSATWEIRQGDCVESMSAMPDCSIDAVVCDPPYGIGFMGHEWDQPGDHAAVRAQGRPGPFASGRPQRGPHAAGPGAAAARSAQKRATHPAPSGFTKQTGGVPGSGGAMEAGRYDLSLTANRRFQAWCEAWAREAFRVLKPGGHMLVCGGTRTYHRMASGIEDAGFEIRDCLVWLYGSGFPKSLDVSKAIDKGAGAERAAVGQRRWAGRDPNGTALGQMNDDSWEAKPDHEMPETVPATPDAERWDGWGTALKPAHEPIVVARKPLVGTVAANVVEHGTGALNVNGCRIASGERPLREPIGGDGHVYGAGLEGGRAVGQTSEGRWPANVVLDEEAAELLDEQTGELTSGANPTSRGSDKFCTAYGDFEGQRECEPARGVDRGGASRFFYCAKASRAERNAGLEALPTSVERATVTPTSTIHRGRSGGERVDEREYEPAARANHHPTVKPISLMRWLVRLVTPPRGLVLDPFCGSGTTGCAAVLEGFDFVGLEREPEYVAIANARLAYWADPVKAEAAAALERAARAREAEERAGGPVQLGFEESVA